MPEEEHVALHLSDATFEAEILKFDGVALVDFWAPWCGPCRMIAPIIEQLAVKYQGNDKVKIAKLDVDENQETAQNFQVMSIPSLKIFKKGEIVEEFSGVIPAPVLQQKIDQAAK